MSDASLDQSDESRRQPLTTLSPSNRIAELSEIDHSVSKLLSSAAEAIAILSNTSLSTSASLTTAQTIFSSATSTYFSTLSSIEVRLRRQVYALEEAGLIHPGDDRDARRGRAVGQEAGTLSTGGGPLDSSWLNARAHDRAGESMDQEIRARWKLFIDKVEQQNGGQDSTDVKMKVEEDDVK